MVLVVLTAHRVKQHFRFLEGAQNFRVIGEPEHDVTHSYSRYYRACTVAMEERFMHVLVFSPKMKSFRQSLERENYRGLSLNNAS